MKQLIGRILARYGYRITSAPPSDSPRLLEAVLYGALARSGAPLRIVQVGANDGHHDDPLVRVIAKAGHRVRALLIEPQPYAFAKLSARYGEDPRITLANVAVGEGSLKLYALAEEHWPQYQRAHGRPPDLIASVHRDHVATRVADRLGVSVDQARRLVVPIDVKFVSLPQLLSETGFGEGIDVLQVDAEGHDDQIILSLDLGNGPYIIQYEAKNLPQDRRRGLARWLDEAGYLRFPDGGDECAIRIAIT